MEEDIPNFKKKQPNKIITSELRQGIDKIENEIINGNYRLNFSGLEQNLKGNNKNNLLHDNEKRFEVIKKLLVEEVRNRLKKISNIYEKFPKIVNNILEIAINYEEAAEKDFAYKVRKNYILS